MFKTVATFLRFTLALNDGSEIHSNEFEGPVNLGQFIAEHGLDPTNAMDPQME
ncbi:hypothetical protein [Bremerella volcania]|nr:hypothetical protein [Bremerella volcania]